LTCARRRLILCSLGTRHGRRIAGAPRPPHEFLAAFGHALRTPGPHLIEAVVPPSLTGLKLRVLPHLLQSLANLPQPIARALKRKIAP
jgi:acetolactate synthase-1/2/3 large subunit